MLNVAFLPVWSIHVYVYTCMCIWTYIYTHVYTTCLCMCNMHACMHANIQTCKHTNMQTYKQTNKQTHIQTNKLTSNQASKQTNIRTCMHTCIQTYIHTCILHMYVRMYFMTFVVLGPFGGRRAPKQSLQAVTCPCACCCWVAGFRVDLVSCALRAWLPDLEGRGTYSWLHKCSDNPIVHLHGPEVELVRL